MPVGQQKRRAGASGLGCAHGLHDLGQHAPREGPSAVRPVDRHHAAQEPIEKRAGPLFQRPIDRRLGGCPACHLATRPGAAAMKSHASWVEPGELGPGRGLGPGLHLRCRRRGAAGEPMGALNRQVWGYARTWSTKRAWRRDGVELRRVLGSYAHPAHNELEASTAWSCVAPRSSPAPGPLVLHLLKRLGTATAGWACGQSHSERWAGLVRLVSPCPVRWARGIVQARSAACPPGGRQGISGERWSSLASVAEAKPQRRTVHTLVVWAAKMSTAGGVLRRRSRSRQVA